MLVICQGVWEELVYKGEASRICDTKEGGFEASIIHYTKEYSVIEASRRRYTKEEGLTRDSWGIFIPNSKHLDSLNQQMR